MRACELTSEHVGKTVAWRCWDYPDYPLWGGNPRSVREWATVKGATSKRLYEGPAKYQGYALPDGAVMVQGTRDDGGPASYVIPGHWEVTVD